MTQTDVMAAWKMLQVLIAEALANGQRVELGELGILSLDVRTKELKEPSTPTPCRHRGGQRQLQTRCIVVEAAAARDLQD